MAKSRNPTPASTPDSQRALCLALIAEVFSDLVIQVTLFYLPLAQTTQTTQTTFHDTPESIVVETKVTEF
jgi:hypothetical protein